jgi:pimeloyl-ACP methyl ester carboxylesterase
MDQEVKIFAERLTGFVKSEDDEIYYEACGKGKAIVFCHGAGDNHALWYQKVPALVTRYRVITWDQRGFGRSTNRSETSGPAAAVRDLSALLNENLPIGFEHPCLATDFTKREPARAFLFLQFSSLGPPTSLSTLLGLVEVSYTSEQVKTLEVPVLFIVGSFDPLFPVADIRMGAQLIPHSIH